MTLIKDIDDFLNKLEKGQVVRGLNEIMLSAAGLNAIPLEQLKGDIARAGFPVERTLALDAENRRLFFTDVNGGFMFAEYGRPEEAFQIKRIGTQSEIAKEYDVIDPDDPHRGDFKTTHYEEEYEESDPGMIPSGTPGDKPEDEDRDGFGDEELDVLGKALAKVRGVLKQPPRPGLVPQSGDPEHPGRWVRPESQRRPGGQKPMRPVEVVDPEVQRARDQLTSILNGDKEVLREVQEEAFDASGEVPDKATIIRVLSREAEGRPGHEALEPADEGRREGGSADPEMQRARDQLRAILGGDESVLREVQEEAFDASGRRVSRDQVIRVLEREAGGLEGHEALEPTEQKASMSADPVERARRLRNSLRTSGDVRKRGAHKQHPGHGNWRRAMTRGGRNGR